MDRFVLLVLAGPYFFTLLLYGQHLSSEMHPVCCFVALLLRVLSNFLQRPKFLDFRETVLVIYKQNRVW